MTERKPQKALYPDADLAAWIEATAAESDRSESYVLRKIVEDVRDSASGDALDVNRIEFTVQDDTVTE